MAPIDRYRQPRDLPGQIPVFPLRGVILLPRASLPLNIFEPRYLAMLDHVVSGARILGIVQPACAADDAESPAGNAAPLRTVGCAGRLTAYQELDDGRLIIALGGIVRFRTVGEVETAKPFRVFNVSYDEFRVDFARDAGENLIDRNNLMTVLRKYLEAHKLTADWKSIAKAPMEYLVNTLSVISPYSPEEKQALLEAADLKSRADALVALAEMDIASSGDGGTGRTLQ